MIEGFLFETMVATLRIVVLLFPLFLIFEGISRKLDAQISARVGPGLAVGWIDYLKAVTKIEREKKESLWLNSFFVLAVALFSLVPWSVSAEPHDFELRLHLYFSLTILFLATHFLFQFRKLRNEKSLFPSQEIFLFFLMLTVIVLNESSLILIDQNENTGFFWTLISYALVLVQIFIGLILFYFRSDSKDIFEKETMRNRLIFFNFSKFVAGMSWICLHFSFIHAESRLTVVSFIVGFLLFVGLKVVMEGYTRLNEKLTGLLTWKFFFPLSLSLFLLILIGDWVS